jgi:hypothetical protein
MFRATVAMLALIVAVVSMSSREAQAFGRRHAAPGVLVALCVDDPCDCCGPQEVCVCVPCCCTEAPCVSWRNGVFGRRVATYTWACCRYSVDVVVTRRGELIVR